jgi:hypothetical protein
VHFFTIGWGLADPWGKRELRFGARLDLLVVKINKFDGGNVDVVVASLRSFNRFFLEKVSATLKKHIKTSIFSAKKAEENLKQSLNRPTPRPNTFIHTVHRQMSCPLFSACFLFFSHTFWSAGGSDKIWQASQSLS